MHKNFIYHGMTDGGMNLNLLMNAITIIGILTIGPLLSNVNKWW